MNFCNRVISLVLIFQGLSEVSNGALHAKSTHYNLSLQGIQSNFMSAADPTGGNNGLPIIDMTIPTVISVNLHREHAKVGIEIEPFSFTLTQTGFMISQNLLPQSYAPARPQWVDFDAGAGVVGHIFRDGSIRYSGPSNQPLNAGTYSLPFTKVCFSDAQFPEKAHGFFEFNDRLVRCSNFPISMGQTNQGGLPVSVNNAFDYGEYYGMVFYNGVIYTTTTDNSFNSNDTPIVVFNEVDKNGAHSIPQVNVVPPGFANGTSPATGFPQLGEESLSINPLNPLQLATTVYTYHTPEPTLPVAFLFLSNDGGSTWNLLDPFASLGTVPTLPGFSQPLQASDQQCVFDSFGNLFYAPLCGIFNLTDFSITTVQYVVMSGDGGVTWQLVDFVPFINPATYGFDYPKIATGPGPDGSSVTWLMLKQDISFTEIEGFGATLPVLAAAYQTTAPGIVSKKAYFELPGSEIGGYGTIAVGPKGEVLVVGNSVNNAVGSLPYLNATLWFSFNKCGIDGAFTPIETVANSNTGYVEPYLPQKNRTTWSHPNAVIDCKGRWYMTYVDQPSPHINQPNPNIYLVYSDTRGKNWSTPLRINNDVNNTTFHIMPQLYVDPISNDLAITWLDTREDAQDTLTRLWATVIKNGSLPKN